MGCVQGRHGSLRTDGPPGIITTVGGYGGSNNQKGKNQQGYQIVAPDPGWRRLPCSVALPGVGVASGTVCQNPTEWSHSSPMHSRKSKTSSSTSGPECAQSSYPAPHSWIVCFFNDRSGHFCNVSIVTLAINMAVRAEKLANTFGILNDFEGVQPRSASMEGFTKDFEEAPDSHRKIYTVLRVPDFGWRLLKRQASDNSESPGWTRDGRKKTAASVKSQKVSEMIDAPHKLRPQLIRRGSIGDPVWADVSEIGMNIAEQLFRLERKKDNRNFLPTDMFGWRFSDMEMEEEFRVAVSSPEGEAFWLVPEDLIMNVTQWVQQTYLTSTAF